MSDEKYVTDRPINAFLGNSVPMKLVAADQCPNKDDELVALSKTSSRSNSLISPESGYRSLRDSLCEENASAPSKFGAIGVSSVRNRSLNLQSESNAAAAAANNNNTLLLESRARSASYPNNNNNNNNVPSVQWANIPGTKDLFYLKPPPGISVATIPIFTSKGSLVGEYNAKSLSPEHSFVPTRTLTDSSDVSDGIHAAYPSNQQQQHHIQHAIDVSKSLPECPELNSAMIVPQSNSATIWTPSPALPGSVSPKTLMESPAPVHSLDQLFENLDLSSSTSSSSSSDGAPASVIKFDRIIGEKSITNCPVLPGVPNRNPSIYNQITAIPPYAKPDFLRWVPQQQPLPQSTLSQPFLSNPRLLDHRISSVGVPICELVRLVFVEHLNPICVYYDLSETVIDQLIEIVLHRDRFNARPLRSQSIEPSILKQTIKRSMIGIRIEICVFCRNNGENILLSTSHFLKDSERRIVCPVLSNYTCTLCGATGQSAHTLKYCPNNLFQAALAYGRQPNPFVDQWIQLHNQINLQRSPQSNLNRINNDSLQSNTNNNLLLTNSDPNAQAAYNHPKDHICNH